ncbi:DegV family protein [Paenibacillus yanchengensis]|uniref:DegV family protein n=1 Tax=Paenibacillus yanchengensis TaxID=2035833 RepID=A0ABW4YMD1_9BACL
MSKVRIVVDSTADMPLEEREQFGITMIPLKIHFGEDTLLDAVTMSTEQFYERLIQSPVLPTTSQPSPIEFTQVYEQILKEDPGAAIISIHLAAVLSGTYQSATIAQSMLEDEADITVIDSKSASYGIGLQVIRAAEMARDGHSKEDILAEIQRLQDGLQLYFLVDTLEYLQKGGRIGKAAALFGSLLNIKPILTLDESGQVMPKEKVRGSKKAMARIVELLKEEFGSDSVHLILAFTKNKEAAVMELGERMKQELNVKKISYTTVGAVIGTHTGPGTSAVFMYRV